MYIWEVISQAWPVILIMGVIFCVFLTIAPQKEEWESLDDYYYKKAFDSKEVDNIDGHKPDLDK